MEGQTEGGLVLLQAEALTHGGAGQLGGGPAPGLVVGDLQPSRGVHLGAVVVGDDRLVLGVEDKRRVVARPIVTAELADVELGSIVAQ